jgi:type III secretory pathway component EscT
MSVFGVLPLIPIQSLTVSAETPTQVWVVLLRQILIGIRIGFVVVSCCMWYVSKVLRHILIPYMHVVSGM